MDNQKVVRTALWANVAFAEIGALAAFFLGGKWTVINDLTNGQSTEFGIELLILAGLATYAAWKPSLNKGLLRVIVGFNTLLFIYFLTRLVDSSVSSMGMEVICLDALIVLALIVVQVRALRSVSQSSSPNVVA